MALKVEKLNELILLKEAKPKKAWNVINVDVGDNVLCDFCNTDYTTSRESGGFMFGSSAICPGCAENTLKTIKKCQELGSIKSFCPDGMSFADYIRSIR